MQQSSPSLPSRPVPLPPAPSVRLLLPSALKARCEEAEARCAVGAKASEEARARCEVLAKQLVRHQ